MTITFVLHGHAIVLVHDEAFLFEQASTTSILQD